MSNALPQFPAGIKPLSKTVENLTRKIEYAAQVTVFAYGGFDGSSLIALQKEAELDSMTRGFSENMRRLKGEKTSGLHFEVCFGDALILRSRSRVASQFYKNYGPGDVLFMLDHDVSFMPGDIKYVINLAHELDTVVGGIYCKRVHGKGLASRPKDIGATSKQRIFVGTNQLLEAEYVATGFMAIPWTVLDDIKNSTESVSYVHDKFNVIESNPSDVTFVKDGQSERYEYWTFFDTMLVPHTVFEGANELLSEDWAFCYRVSDVREKLYLASGPILGHAGRYVYQIPDAYLAAGDSGKLEKPLPPQAGKDLHKGV